MLKLVNAIGGGMLLASGANALVTRLDIDTLKTCGTIGAFYNVNALVSVGTARTTGRGVVSVTGHIGAVGATGKCHIAAATVVDVGGVATCGFGNARMIAAVGN